MVLEHPLWAPGPDGDEFEHSALLDRRMVEATFRTGGALTSHAIDALQVTERAAGANMSVDIHPGMCVIPGTSIGNQGHYLCRSTAVENRSVSAAPGSGTRTDIVIARVRDSSVTGTQDGFFIEVLNGTTSVPDDAIELARIEVPAGSSSVTSDMITDTRQPVGTGGGPLATLVFTSSDTFNKVDYPWMRAVRVRLVGGGGAGGGAQSTTSGNVRVGRAGAGAAYATSIIDVSELSSSETVTIGAGGLGAVSTTGGDGGQSSFGSHVIANGGDGGGIAPASSDFVSRTPAAGGATGTGDFVVPGATGEGSLQLGGVDGYAGTGGHSRYGNGGGPNGSEADGNPGTGYGSGGSGAITRGDDTNSLKGGDGTPGVVILELYA